MISLPQRQQIMQWVAQAKAAGARYHKACELLGITPRTLQRWRQCGALLGDARSTRGFGTVKISIECFGVFTRNPRAHVPTFTDNYLPAVNSLTKSGTGLL